MVDRDRHFELIDSRLNGSVAWQPVDDLKG
jgi:hypothetical protein